MRRSLALTISSLFVFVSVNALSAEDQPVLLRYKMPAEGKLIYKTTSTVGLSQSINNTEFTTTVESEAIGTHVLKGTDDQGDIRIEHENKLLKVTMDVPQLGEYVFDSTKEERDTGSLLGGAVTPLYDRLSGAIVTYTISPLGKITKLEGYKELVADLLQNNPIASQFAAGGTDDAARLEMSETRPELPENPVKPGDTWEANYEVPLPKIGSAQGKKVYTFEAFDQVGDTKTARIRVSSELNYDIDLEVNEAKVTGNMKSNDSSGTLQFDIERGEIVSLDVKYTITGDMTVTAGGNTIPLKQDQTQNLKMERIDKLPDGVE